MDLKFPFWDHYCASAKQPVSQPYSFAAVRFMQVEPMLSVVDDYIAFA